MNIYVYNYYDSTISLVFETFKALAIVGYLVYALGSLTIVGLAMSGFFVMCTLGLTRRIQQATFAVIECKQNKVNLLSTYLSRIVDFQMSWLDGLVGRLLQAEERDIQGHLRTSKMLDCWCVGLWQFTQVGISSTVLCLYYWLYGLPSAHFEPATIIFLFQMLTFPMNVISWNIAGINNALASIQQIPLSQRSPHSAKPRRQPHPATPGHFLLDHTT